MPNRDRCLKEGMIASVHVEQAESADCSRGSGNGPDDRGIGIE